MRFTRNSHSRKYNFWNQTIFNIKNWICQSMHC